METIINEVINKKKNEEDVLRNKGILSAKNIMHEIKRENSQMYNIVMDKLKKLQNSDVKIPRSEIDEKLYPDLDVLKQCYPNVYSDVCGLFGPISMPRS